MNSMKNLARFYLRTIPFASALTIGNDLQKTNKWPLKERTLEIAEDLCLTLIWPITAPSAIRTFVNNLDLPPYDDY